MVKLGIGTLLLAVAVLGASCATTTHDKGEVVAIKGVNTPYLLRLVQGHDGTAPMPIYGQVFEGWKFIEGENGTCWMEHSAVVEMTKIDTPPGPVTRPKTKLIAFKVPCKELDKDALPTLPEIAPNKPTSNKLI